MSHRGRPRYVNASAGKASRPPAPARTPSKVFVDIVTKPRPGLQSNDSLSTHSTSHLRPNMTTPSSTGDAISAAPSQHSYTSKASPAEADEMNIISPNNTSPSNQHRKLRHSPETETPRVGPPRKRQRQETRSSSHQEGSAGHHHMHLSEIARGKQRAGSSTPSVSTSHRKRLPSAGASERKSVPTWETLTPITSTTPDSVAEGQPETPTPGQYTQCAGCEQSFITEKANLMYCGKCRFDALNRHKHFKTAASPSLAMDGLSDPVGDELDEKEVESVMLNSSGPHCTSDPGDLQEHPCHATPLFSRNSDPLQEVHPNPQANPNNIIILPKTSTSTNEYQHINDLLYHLAGITNSIQPSTSSQPAATINFKGVVTRPLDITRYPHFPLISETLLNEISLEVKAKSFLPFILPRKQFKTNHGHCLGVVFSCQCNEGIPGEPCPGKLQVAVTALQSEPGPPAISINVALEH